VQAAHAASEVASPEQREEYAAVTQEMWDFVLGKAFGFRDIKPLPLHRVRYLTLKVCHSCFRFRSTASLLRCPLQAYIYSIYTYMSLFFLRFILNRSILLVFVFVVVFYLIDLHSIVMSGILIVHFRSSAVEPRCGVSHRSQCRL
jgi:hypothetical protein